MHAGQIQSMGFAGCALTMGWVEVGLGGVLDLGSCIRCVWIAGVDWLPCKDGKLFDDFDVSGLKVHICPNRAKTQKCASKAAGVKVWVGVGVSS